ncbi:MAG: 3-oxoacyl-[acyl-carrier-protein] reductase [Defluviitaleaceae bacterium]|nr:3-oxoacyl-[acyl-carrier-protein] reductase [Defluviitaleaceae bacterium]
MAKTALITGAARGIGRAIAVRMAKDGYDIAAADRAPTPEDLLAELRALGVAAEAFCADISSFDETASLVAQVKERFGSIDLLVNNAGITRDGLLMRMSEADFDAVIQVNLKGAFNMIRNCAKVFTKQRSGCIVNMASVVGIIGNVGQANYAASKAGLIGLTKSAAKELAMFGVRCNAVAPGYIDTDMTRGLPQKVKDDFLARIPLNRFGAIDDVAGAVAYLAKSGYVTGQVMCVDGGLVM